MASMSRIRSKLGFIGLVTSLLIFIGCQGSTSSRSYSDGGTATQTTSTPTTDTSSTTASAPDQTTQKSQPANPQPTPSLAGSDMTQRLSMAYPTGDPDTSAIGIEKSVPREVRLNQPFSYQFKVTNLTNQSLQNVVVSDQLGKNMTVKSSSPGGQMNQKSGLVRWTLDTLGPNQVKTIQVTAVATAEGAASSCASVEYNSSLCTSIPVVQPKLLVEMTGPAEVLACDDIVYKIRATNTGTGSVRDVKIDSAWAPGLVAKQAGQATQFNLGTLAPGQSRETTATLRATKTGQFINKASVKGSGNLTASSAPVTTVVRKPVLSIKKEGPSKKFIGRTVTYNITVTNTGDGIAKDTVIQDVLAAGLKMVRASDGGQLADGKVIWKVGTLQPKASKKVSVTAMGEDAGMFSNTAVAKAYCADQVSDSVQTQYKGIPAILLEVVDLEDPIEVGENVTYVITATNQGSAPGTNVKIVCTLEDSLKHVSSTGATSGNLAGNTVTFSPVASLPPGKKATWRLVAKAVKSEDVRFRVSMTSDQLSRPVEETEATNLY